jgi:hypothetical protein
MFTFRKVGLKSLASLSPDYKPNKDNLLTFTPAPLSDSKRDVANCPSAWRYPELRIVTEITGNYYGIHLSITPFLFKADCGTKKPQRVCLTNNTTVSWPLRYINKKPV